MTASSRPAEVFRTISLPSERARRFALIEAMAADLVKYDALNSEQDGMMALVGRGYRAFDVAAMLGEARAVAFQSIVAREMGES